MNPKIYTIDRTRKLLAIGLAGLLVATTASAQSADTSSLRQLQEENAALRKRLADLEAKSQPAAPATPAVASAPTQATPVAAPEPTDKNLLILSPFEVKSEKDYGYLKTNSVTATRIGMAIQDVPMSISVLSQEFIQDTNSRS
ncbi:MAG: iron complex outerrane recepter protein, partial [Verrucomicrobiota bacterium]|nr:iron complex outerrane recepter protein [Verrucomicrobiota bacterium]